MNETCTWNVKEPRPHPLIGHKQGNFFRKCSWSTMSHHVIFCFLCFFPKQLLCNWIYWHNYIMLPGLPSPWLSLELIMLGTDSVSETYVSHLKGPEMGQSPQGGNPRAKAWKLILIKWNFTRGPDRNIFFPKCLEQESKWWSRGLWLSRPTLPTSWGFVPREWGDLSSAKITWHPWLWP